MASTKGTSMLYTIKTLYEELDETFQQHLHDSQDSRCLLNLLRFAAADLMPALVHYFLKFYETKNNTFCFNGQVLSITLEDILFLTGPPIDGDAVISNDNRDLDGFHRVFGLEKEKEKSTKELKRVATDVSLDYQVRKKAVLILIVRCFIVPSSNGHKVTTTYLRYIDDFSRVDSYAWGAALLAYLYHSIDMCKRNKSEKKNLEGNTWVILSFFLLRIPKLQTALSIKLDVSQLHIPFMLTIVDQVQMISRNHRANFEEVLDNIFLNLSHEDVVWTPYCMSDHPQKKFGTRVGPIICNNYVVHHQPHIAHKQFPVFDQYRLETLKSKWRPYKIHFKKNSGNYPQNLLKHYKNEFEWWNAKHLAQELMEEKNIIVNSRLASRKRHNRSAPSPLPRPSPQPSAHNEDISESGGSNILEEENLSPPPRPSPQPSAHNKDSREAVHNEPAHDKESNESEEEGELKENEQPILKSGQRNEEACALREEIQTFVADLKVNSADFKDATKAHPEPSPLPAERPVHSVKTHLEVTKTYTRRKKSERNEHNEEEYKHMERRELLKRLEPHKFLSADVLYYYVSYLKRTYSKAFLLLNTYIYGRLEIDFGNASNKTNVNIKMGWWKGAFDEYSYILFPICTEKHFSLAIVCFMDEREGAGQILILHLDSLRYHQSGRIFDTIEWTLKQKWGRATSDFPPTVRKIVEVPQQPNLHDCGLFVIQMMKLFLQQAPPRFKNDNLKMFGLNWFDPQDACALRESVKAITQKELERCWLEAGQQDVNVPCVYKYGRTYAKKRHREMDEEESLRRQREQRVEPIFHTVPEASASPVNHEKVSQLEQRVEPIFHTVPEASAPPVNHEKVSRRRTKMTRPRTKMTMKLRGNIKTLHGHWMKRKQIRYADLENQYSTGYSHFKSANLTPVMQKSMDLRSTIRTVLGNRRKRKQVDYAQLSKKYRKGYRLFG